MNATGHDSFHALYWVAVEDYGKRVVRGLLESPRRMLWLQVKIRHFLLTY